MWLDLRRKPAVRKVNWLEVAQTTLHARSALAFYKDGTAEEMAAAGDAAMARGASIDEAIDAVSTACRRNEYYSTPHEHPCDEWQWCDVMRAAA